MGSQRTVSCELWRCMWLWLVFAFIVKFMSTCKKNGSVAFMLLAERKGGNWRALNMFICKWFRKRWRVSFAPKQLHGLIKRGGCGRKDELHPGSPTDGMNRRLLGSFTWPLGATAWRMRTSKNPGGLWSLHNHMTCNLYISQKNKGGGFFLTQKRFWCQGSLPSFPLDVVEKKLQLPPLLTSSN